MEDSKVNEVGSVILHPKPVGIAVQAGPVAIGDRILVSDADFSRILGVSLLTPMTTVLATIGQGPGQVNFPKGIAVDPNTRNIFVVDGSNHRVQKFSPNFVFIKAWGSDGTGDGQFSFPKGIAIDSNDDIYVVDFGNHRVQKSDVRGNFIKAWGSPGSGDGQFNEPVDITFNKLNGTLLVSDFENRNIQVFTTNGVFSGKVQFDIIVHP
ncbi:MAG TPA: hypothetical protein VJL78_03455 [Candidatus Nitrosocosmicus sp.]|jgi:tripartite motif-containing protein 71|nr:hypothetical protein [Candidatus Nitrosocosmicus sp.]